MCMNPHCSTKLRKSLFLYFKFWGKIIGTEKDYIVAEADLLEEEYIKREETIQAAELAKKAAEEEAAKQIAMDMAPPPVKTVTIKSTPGTLEEETEEEPPEATPEDALKEGEEKKEEDLAEKAPEDVPVTLAKPFPVYPILQSTYKPPVNIPRETAGLGTNKKVYFVCNDPTDEWVMLPDVTPKELVVARQIKRFFTGNLESEVVTYPEFPGKEVNYLRAQIARISAATQISPLGYFSFGGEDEEEEEEPEEDQVLTSYRKNPNFEIVRLVDLLDKTMSYWVHHTFHILKQGRSFFYSSRENPEGEEEELEEEAEDEEKEEKEVGPSLLTPCSEDANLERIPAWTTRMSSTLIPDYAVALVRSNLWPGAYAFARGRSFENVYIGQGHKCMSRYSPSAMEVIQDEYATGPEIMESFDPTPKEEEAWRIAHEPKPKPELLGEEEEAPVEEEEEEDDEDDE